MALAKLTGTKFTRRRFLGTLGATAAVAGLAGANTGCQSIQQALSGKPAGGGAATIRYMGHFTALGDTARDRAQKQIEEKFKAKYPNTTIQWEQTAWETIGEKYMAAWSANTAPDISLFSPANITPAVRLGSLEDLTPSFNKWADNDKKDLSKAWWDTGTYEGKKYIAPLLLFGDLMMYRKSLFDQAGVKIDDIKTWKQFVEACQKVVKDGQGRGPDHASFDESTVKVWGWHWYLARGSGAGIPWFGHLNQDRLNRYDLGPPDWKADHWTSPEIVEASQFMVDWVLKYKIQPRSSLTYTLEDSDNKFVSGLSAVYQFGTHRYGSWQEKMQFPVEDAVWARFPTWDGKRWGPAFINHWSMGVSSRSKFKDQAIDLTSFWMGPDADLIMGDVAGQQPKRSSVSTNAVFNRPDRSYVKLFDVAAREWSMPLLSPPVRPTDIYIQAYHKMVNERVPALAALEEARDTYNKLLAEIPADKIPRY
jgi:ABC-type glycerol-3-phosphate transport system substrate-binding protein